MKLKKRERELLLCLNSGLLGSSQEVKALDVRRNPRGRRARVVHAVMYCRAGWNPL